MRTIIFHYHLFKNAGTSVDALLKHNFPGTWVTREFASAPAAVHARQVRDWILEEKDALAFSSHTAQLPPPQIEGVRVLPLIFVRHPIDRIVSAYTFERKQGGDGFGAVLARNTSLAGYIETRLSLPNDRQCRNFHVARFGQMYRPEEGTELERALRAVDELPFVGLVEQFDASVVQLADWLRPEFPGFEPLSVSKNVTRDQSLTLEHKLLELKSDLGENLYQRVTEVNQEDLRLYHQCCLPFKAVSED